MKVIVLHDQVKADARSDEADALVQAQAVCGALRALGEEPVTLDISLDLETAAARIDAIAPDLVFNLVESLGGHGRLIHIAPGLLDVLGIPYTGASAEAQFATSNKLIAKRMMQAAGVPTAPWHTLESLSAGGGIEPGRYILKSVWEHASVGLDEDSIIEIDDSPGGASRLHDALAGRLDRIGGEGFAEAYIDGREFNLGMLADGSGGVEVLPPAEIVFEGYGAGKPRVVGYRAKWDEGSYEYHHTPRRYAFLGSDRQLLDQLTAIARECWDLFRLRGYARVDFRIDGSNDPWVLEVNTNPCLSPDAGFAAALDQAGIPFEDAVRRIINDTLRGAAQDPRACAGSTAR